MTQTCPIRVRNAGNVPLYDIIVQSASMPNNCSITALDPTAASVQCVTEVLLTADDFMRSFVHVSGSAAADGALGVTFNTQVDLRVTRSVAVEVLPGFKLPSKPLAVLSVQRLLSCFQLTEPIGNLVCTVG